MKNSLLLILCLIVFNGLTQQTDPKISFTGIEVPGRFQYKRILFDSIVLTCFKSTQASSKLYTHIFDTTTKRFTTKDLGRPARDYQLEFHATFPVFIGDSLFKFYANSKKIELRGLNSKSFFRNRNDILLYKTDEKLKEFNHFIEKNNFILTIQETSPVEKGPLKALIFDKTEPNNPFEFNPSESDEFHWGVESFDLTGNGNMVLLLNRRTEKKQLPRYYKTRTIDLFVKGKQTDIEASYTFDEDLFGSLSIENINNEIYILGYTSNFIENDYFSVFVLRLEGNNLIKVDSKKIMFSEILEDNKRPNATKWIKGDIVKGKGASSSFTTTSYRESHPYDGGIINVDQIALYAKNTDWVTPVLIYKLDSTGKINWENYFSAPREIVTSGVDSKGNTHIFLNDLTSRYYENGEFRSFDEEVNGNASPVHVQISKNGENIYRKIIKDNFAKGDIFTVGLRGVHYSNSTFLIGKQEQPKGYLTYMYSPALSWYRSLEYLIVKPTYFGTIKLD